MPVAKKSALPAVLELVKACRLWGGEEAYGIFEG